MADDTFRRALRSSDLPRPRPGEWTRAPTRKRALSATVSTPEFREVTVAGKPVLLTRLPSGKAVAFAAHCPHQGTSLRAASLFEGNLRCPRHNYVYDLSTGRNILPTREARPQALERLKPGHLVIYSVQEREGWIFVSETPHPSPPPPEAPSDARGADHAPADTVEHHEETLTAVLGRPLELVLPTSSPKPGHVWRLEAEDAAVEILGQRYEEQVEALSYRVVLRPRREGVVRFRFLYGLPWARQPSAVRPFVVQVACAPRTARATQPDLPAAPA